MVRRMIRTLKKMPGLPARQVALAALENVLEEGTSPDAALTAAVADHNLAPNDRGLSWHIILSVLRFGREADAAITPHLRDPDALPTEIHLILWMGYVQLHVLEMPAHAVLSTTVELSKNIAGGHLSGLVNAVMRKIAAHPVADDAMRGWRNLAHWLQQRWQDHYGRTEAAAMAAQLLVPPLLDVTVKNNPAQWAEQTGGMHLPNTATVRLPAATPVTGLPGFAEGAFWVQDAASALPVALLGDISGQDVLEIGAAPGGKTAQLIQAGAKVTALDISAPRMERLRENLQRLRFTADLVVADALVWQPAQSFDTIVLDAPCSATGTQRRHPELGWQKDESDVLRLADLQSRLLDRVAPWVKAGGQLLFMTCSLEPEEGEKQLAAFLQRHRDYRLEKLSAPFGTVLPDGSLRIMPTALKQWGGNDGFFVARLRRS